MVGEELFNLDDYQLPDFYDDIVEDLSAEEEELNMKKKTFLYVAS